MNNKFDIDFKKFESGEYGENEFLKIASKTPRYLYNLGFEETFPIAINMTKLNKIMEVSSVNPHKHGLTKEIIKALPEALNNPLNVIKSNKFNDRYIIVTELSDNNGDIIILPIEANSKGYINDIETDINKINSIYGKEQYDGNDNPNILGYMEQNKNNIVYDIDKNFTKKRVINPTLQLRKANNSSEINISQLNANVKPDISNNYDMQDKENNKHNLIIIEENELKEISGGSISVLLIKNISFGVLPKAI